MKKLVYLVLVFLSLAGILYAAENEPNRPARVKKNVRDNRSRVLQRLELPAVDIEGQFTLEKVISARRSVRMFRQEPLDMEVMAQLLWAGQGITDEKNSYRAAPSAGAIYPFRLYVVIRGGVYIYDPAGEKLEKIINGDVRGKLAKSALGQSAITQAPCSIILAGNARGLIEKYSNDAKRFLYLEAGHIAQNILLQGTAMGLGGVPIGSFDEDKIKELCRFPSGTEAVYIISLGYPAAGPLLSAEDKTVAKTPEATEKLRAVMIIPDERFSDRELFDTLDGLSVAGFDVDIAGTELDIYEGDQRGIIETSVLINDISVDDYDAFVLVSGRRIEAFTKNSAVLDIIYDAWTGQKVVAAIGRSTKVLGLAGVVDGYDVTGDNSARTTLRKSGANFTAGRVERDDNVVTAQDYESAAQFARLISEAVSGRHSLSPSSSGRYVPRNVRRRRGEPTR
jgi:SagB-type dehydrogenase family enzyme